VRAKLWCVGCVRCEALVNFLNADLRQAIVLRDPLVHYPSLLTHLHHSHFPAASQACIDFSRLGVPHKYITITTSFEDLQTRVRDQS
jgi:hypothetical protein